MSHWLTQVNKRRFFFGLCGGALALVVSALAQVTPVAADSYATGIQTHNGQRFYFSLTDNRPATQILENNIGLYYDRPGSYQVTLHQPWDGQRRKWYSGDFIIGADYTNANGSHHLYTATPENAYRTFTVHVPNQRDPDTGKYRVLLRMYVRTIRSAKDSAFRFAVSTDGLVRAIASRSTGFESAYFSRTPSHGRYSIRFGSICTMTSSQVRRIGVFDPDNTGQNVWNIAQRQRKFYVELWGGPKGSSMWLNHRWTPGVSSNKWEYETATFHPNWQYELVFVGLDHNNTIQLELPFDSIYYDVPCQQWTAGATSRVRVNGGPEQQQATAKPGDRIRFFHALRNTSAYDIPPRTLEIGIDQRLNGGRASYHQWTARYEHVGSAGHTFYTPGNVQPYNNALAGGDQVGQDDVGKEICQQLSWRPRAWNTSEWGASGATTGWACVTVPYQFNLRPTINVAASSITEGATIVNGVQASITNDGPTKSNRTNYAVVRFVVRGNESKVIPGDDNVRVPYNPTAPGNLVADWPCVVARQIGARNGLNVDTRDCTGGGLVANGGGTVISKSGLQVMSSQLNDITGLNPNAGDRVCYTTIVSSYDTAHQTATDLFRYAPPSCVNIAKKPKVQFWGGDIRTRADASEVVTNNSARATLVQPSQEELVAAERATQRYWYFGNRAALDFGVSGSRTPVPFRAKRTISGNEGVTVATDKQGRLQFYTDGADVIRADGTLINDPGQKLDGSGTTTQAAAAFPVSNNRYVIVTSSAASEELRKGRIRYSIVDMNLNGGRGKITALNKPLGNDESAYITESLSVAPHADGRGYWVVASRAGTNQMLSFAVPYQLPADPVLTQPPVVSATGSITGSATDPGFGTINFSADYAQVVVLNDVNETIRVLRFNQTTGRMIQEYAWRTDAIAGVRQGVNASGYSADFSPSGQYIYVTTLYNLDGRGPFSVLARYNRDGSGGMLIAKLYKNPACPECSGPTGGGQVKRAPNGHMYVASIYHSAISVITRPDAPADGRSTPQALVGFMENAQPLRVAGFTDITSNFGLPQTVAVTMDHLREEPRFTTHMYGSWAEYGIVSPGRVVSASGAGLSSLPDGRTSVTSAHAYNALTFQNQRSPFGMFQTATPPVHALASYFKPTRSLGGAVDMRHVDAGVYQAGNVTVSGGEVQSGRRIVIKSNGVVTIRGNITYVATQHTSAETVPQLIIIAKHIVIEPQVTRVDAWLVAQEGSLTTCDTTVRSSPAWLQGLSVSACENQLVINGHVAARHLYLRRTFTKSGMAPGDHPGVPAEILNLRPDAYLSGQAFARQSGAIKTTHLRELPPRF